MDKKILVGIVMGRDSDLEAMQETAKILDKFSISYEINIISVMLPIKQVKFCE